MAAQELNRMDRRAARVSFERAAATYETNAVLHREVGTRLLERVEHLQQPPRRILDLGCGTGLHGRALATQFSEASIIGLDWSPAMLGRLRPAAGAGAPAAVCADMQAIPLASRSVDLVYSNLAAHWSPDLRRLFGEVRRVLSPGGLFLFSTFGPDTLLELRSAWAAVDDDPHVNAFIDLHDVGDLLLAQGFAEPVMDMEHFTLHYPDVISLMRDLKSIGARNAAAGRRRELTGKDRFRRVLEAYESFVQDGRYPSTWEVVYGAAFGPAEGQPVRAGGQEIAEFTVDSLRRSRRDRSP